MTGTRDLVAAFFGEEVLGIARPMVVAARDSLFFSMKVYSDPDEERKIQFKIFSGEELEVYKSEGDRVRFQPGATVGGWKEPFIVSNSSANLPSRLVVRANNFISPNGDGKNDIFNIQGVNLNVPNKLTIKDIRGWKIIEINGYLNDWGGEDKSGEPLPTGNYLYIFESADYPEPATGIIYIQSDSD